MKVSYNWLKEFVDIDVNPYELADKLTLSGLEVESVFDAKKACCDSVVGKVLSREPIQINLYTLAVDIGEKQLNIVTSDSHLNIGDKIGVAATGTDFRGKVKERKFNSVVSEGFLLSASELGLEESSSNVFVLDSEFDVGTKLKDLGVFKDFIFDISITPNRVDCLSILGIAREVSIYYNKPLKIKECKIIKEDNKFSVTLDKDCQSYIASNIKVSIAPSCFDIRQKLIKSGVRPINNVVDITNYCMLALGQPMHAFDKDKIGTKIIVRNAFKKERIVALNDIEYELEDDLVISDENRSIAIAGIMGGKYSQIDENTRHIVLESAYFIPERIRKTSRKLKLSSESSYRFERGVDPNLNEYATYYAIDLLQQYATANVVGITKKINKQKPKEIMFNVDEINDFLGSSYNKGRFYQLGFDIKGIEPNLIALIPTYRMDIENMEDIAEEVARIDGYDKLPSTNPCVSLRCNPIKNKKDLVRESLKSSGLYETINYSFVNSTLLSKLGRSDNILYLKNPLTQEQDCMRNTLFLGLMENLIFNLNHNIKSIALFEIGKIFDLNSENNSLGIMLHGIKPLNWYTQKNMFDFYDIKGLFEGIFGLFECNIEFRVQELQFMHPKKSLAIYNNNHYIGFFGEVHPDVYDVFDIKFLKSSILYGEILIDGFEKFRSFYFKPLPKFPVVVRDLNIVVDKNEVTSDIKKTISDFDFVYKVNLIDIYDMGNKKSLNFRIELYSPDKTLTEQDIEKLIKEVFLSLNSKFIATIRGEENGL
ncbi:Phenylalanyl-tRNA synthetase beta chain [Desulfurella amilsii]|uniref:Phenylalanine--tRNA ligase beta subunit n=1 Tax=Desulfurella amilsii TaxID=1562698 RepID=A0A1X4XWN5_9BACT|nr:phenylalanine--tRNA ligase subunit beta [Desulfurella amilsii]OSS41928.1 Phenylalanyl-tRNA synthetase beta chain [Desulfurella amilsii]